MPIAGLLALLDDIATMTKVAATKTAGVVGDDLALNANQVVGLSPARELPVVWKVAKGSLKNKGVLILGALGISSFAAWAVTPLLMVGGAYLCYEGVEKFIDHKKKKSEDQPAATEQSDLAALENEKVSSAIRTDFILSAEIVTLTLGMIATAPIVTQVGVLATVGLGMTVGVYGLVGGIVKADDIGLHMASKEGKLPHDRTVRATGRAIVAAAPWVLKGLSIAGTVAMFLVGGGIFTHGIPAIQELTHGMGYFMNALVNTGAGVAVGIAAIPAFKAAEVVYHKTKPFITRGKKAEEDKRSVPGGAPDLRTPIPPPVTPQPGVTPDVSQDLNKVAEPKKNDEKKPPLLVQSAPEKPLLPPGPNP